MIQPILTTKNVYRWKNKAKSLLSHYRSFLASADRNLNQWTTTEEEEEAQAQQFSDRSIFEPSNILSAISHSQHNTMEHPCFPFQSGQLNNNKQRERDLPNWYSVVIVCASLVLPRQRLARDCREFLSENVIHRHTGVEGKKKNNWRQLVVNKKEKVSGQRDPLKPVPD